MEAHLIPSLIKDEVLWEELSRNVDLVSGNINLLMGSIELPQGHLQSLFIA